jgi:hypothetical protein
LIFVSRGGEAEGERRMPVQGAAAAGIGGEEMEIPSSR